MIAVADNGASKCEWIIGDTNSYPQVVTHPGFNPNSGSKTQEKEFTEKLSEQIPESVDKVIFYSAGMGNQVAKEKMLSILNHHFRDAEITIETDLVGTGRAIFGDNKGIAAILGTGANAGYYDGQRITHQPLSLGFLLGDEGSGAYLGKVFFQHYLRGSLPQEIMQLFHGKKLKPPHQLLKEFYENPSPKIFTDILRILESAKDHPFLNELIRKGFDLFFDNIVSRVQRNNIRSIGYTGSVAFHLRHDLERVSNQNGFKVYNIIQHPAQALFTYHLKNPKL